jgi:hypothetical protein
MSTKFYGDNDFAGKCLLEIIDPDTLAVTPLIAGQVDAFITDDLDTGAEVLGLITDAVYLGGVDGNPAGTWGAFFDGGDLAGDELAALGDKFYLCFRKTDDVFAYLELKFVRHRKMTTA